LREIVQRDPEIVNGIEYLSQIGVLRTGIVALQEAVDIRAVK